LFQVKFSLSSSLRSEYDPWGRILNTKLDLKIDLSRLFELDFSDFLTWICKCDSERNFWSQVTNLNLKMSKWSVKLNLKPRYVGTYLGLTFLT